MHVGEVFRTKRRCLFLEWRDINYFKERYSISPSVYRTLLSFYFQHHLFNFNNNTLKIQILLLFLIKLKPILPHTHREYLFNTLTNGDLISFFLESWYFPIFWSDIRISFFSIFKVHSNLDLLHHHLNTYIFYFIYFILYLISITRPS